MIIASRYQSSKQILTFVSDSIAKGQVDFINAEADVGNTLARDLLIAAASYHEHSIKKLILEIYTKCLNNSYLTSFIKCSALDRQYHTFFEWKKQEPQSINKFISYFGNNFKTRFKILVGNEQLLAQAIIDFIYIGGTRNQMVHGNYASFNFPLTLDDVFRKYQSSMLFISRLQAEVFAESCLDLTVETSLTQSHQGS